MNDLSVNGYKGKRHFGLQELLKTATSFLITVNQNWCANNYWEFTGIKNQADFSHTKLRITDLCLASFGTSFHIRILEHPV